MHNVGRNLGYLAVFLMISFSVVWALNTVALRQPTLQTLTLGDNAGSLTFEDRERTYLLHFPAGYDGGRPLPLMIVLHGGGGNAKHAANMTGFNAEADREGFIVVYPQGTGRLRDTLLTWNSGNCCGYALDNKVNDVGFIDALISKLEGEVKIDSSRIYVTGISNGGMMAYRLGCELPNKIAGITLVAGALNADCNPSEPVSVIAFHGTADKHVLYGGGEPIVKADPHSRVDRSVSYAISFWVKADACSAFPQRTEKGNVTVEEYSDCMDGTGVMLYTIKGGGHAWPGGEKPRGVADEPTREVSATHLMWKFLEQHPKQSTLNHPANNAPTLITPQVLARSLGESDVDYVNHSFFVTTTKT